MVSQMTTQMTTNKAQLAVQAFLNTGQTGKAEQVIARAEEAARPDLYCAVAAVYLEQGRLDLAQQAYQQALALQPGHPTASQGKARLLAHQGAALVEQKDLHRAHVLLQEAIQAMPGDPDLMNFAINLELAEAVAGNPDAASGRVIETLEGIYRKDVSKINVAHQLAILNHRLAIESEEGGARTAAANPYWQYALAYWGAALGSDTYWQDWMRIRQAVYSIDESSLPETLAALRFEKAKAGIRAINQEFIKFYTENNNPSMASRHKMLVADWAVELSTAAALKETIRFLQDRHETPALAIPSGPLFWIMFGLEEQAKATAERALKVDSKFAPARQVLESQTPVSKARALKEQGLVGEGIDQLRKHLANNKGDTAAKLLLAEMLSSEAESLKSSDPAGAINRWKEARDLGGDKEAIDNAIVTCCLTRMKVLRDNNETERAKEILKVGMAAVPHALSLKDNYFSIAHTQNMEKFEKAVGQSPSRDRLMNAARAAKVDYEALDRIVGPNHSRVKEQLRQLDEILSKGEASELNQEAVNLVDEAVSNAKYGNRWAARQNLESAHTKLERAMRLDPGDEAIRKNYALVSDLLRQIRGY